MPIDEIMDSSVFTPESVCSDEKKNSDLCAADCSWGVCQNVYTILVETAAVLTAHRLWQNY
jgi:hypothetical protein